MVWVAQVMEGRGASLDHPRVERRRRQGVPLSEGRVPSPLSRAGVRLGDLVHVWTHFGSPLGSRSPSKTQISYQRKLKMSAMLLFEVASMGTLGYNIQILH